MKSLIAAIAFVTVAFTQVQAADRFAVIERSDTIIRVDTETGRVSFCREESGKPVCKIAADERKAWMAEVESLEKRLSQLEGKPSDQSGKLSSKEEKDLERAMDTAETMMRRFFGIIKTMRDDLEKN